MKWIEEEINEAIKLNKEGKRFDEIAFILNRTYKTIKIKLNRLGYNENIINYYENNICKNCRHEFKALITEKREFCSQSCSATYNNKKRKIKRYCLNCNKELKNNKKFCSHKCMGNYLKNNNIKLIEKGVGDFTDIIYKNYLIEKYGENCMKCGWNKIHPITKKVPIQLNHIDGNSENNNLENLELLCPNCHSLTLNFGILNKGNGRLKRKQYRQKQKEKNGYYI